MNTTPTGVVATFADGAIEEGTLLIGAEGAHSVTRQFLFSSSPQDGELLPTPIVAYAAITTVSHDTALAIRRLHPTYCMAMEPEGRFAWANSLSLPFLPPPISFPFSLLFSFPFFPSSADRVK